MANLSDGDILVGLEDASSGDVVTLIQLTTTPAGDWAPELVSHCVDGAYSLDEETSNYDKDSGWYPSAWPDNTTEPYKFDGGIPTEWRDAIRAGLGNFSDRASGVGPEFTPDGVATNPNDLDACNNAFSKVYAATNLQDDAGLLGLTNTCVVNPHGQGAIITKFQITLEAYPDNEYWYFGAGDPGRRWDLESIVTHEAGHATGFVGHFTHREQPQDCPIPRTAAAATMCGGADGVKGTTWIRTLEELDRSALTHTY
jgi:hypothetical protein